MINKIKDVWLVFLDGGKMGFGLLVGYICYYKCICLFVLN